MTTQFPVSALGGDDGQMNFKVTSAQQQTSGSFSGINDFAPDVGLPVGDVATVPEPATALLLLLLPALLRRR